MAKFSLNPATAGVSKNTKIDRFTKSKKIEESIKVIYITEKKRIKNKNTIFLGIVGFIYDTLGNRSKMGTQFILFPQNLEEIEKREEEGYIFPQEIRDLFL